MNYTLSVDRNEKEALSTAFFQANQEIYDRNIFTKELIDSIDPRSQHQTITITDLQLSTALRFLSKAIETQETDMGDWSRAMSWKKARDTLIAKARQQFKIVKEKNAVT